MRSRIVRHLTKSVVRHQVLKTCLHTTLLAHSMLGAISRILPLGVRVPDSPSSSTCRTHLFDRRLRILPNVSCGSRAGDRRQAGTGHQRPFIRAVARTFECRLHPDSGPPPSDYRRHVIGHCARSHVAHMASPIACPVRQFREVRTITPTLCRRSDFGNTRGGYLT